MDLTAGPFAFIQALSFTYPKHLISRGITIIPATNQTHHQPSGESRPYLITTSSLTTKPNGLRFTTSQSSFPSWKITRIPPTKRQNVRVLASRVLQVRRKACPIQPKDPNLLHLIRAAISPASISPATAATSPVKTVLRVVISPVITRVDTNPATTTIRAAINPATIKAVISPDPTSHVPTTTRL